ncbi:hypothetical protein AB0M43_12715 [Longispora sp. NPDC051575]|uniref:hypothetical protein n=1 Tax=Longispora sp. NPDC051575 TaxID=3154943 RepID=UPI003415E6A3
MKKLIRHGWVAGLLAGALFMLGLGVTGYSATATTAVGPGTSSTVVGGPDTFTQVQPTGAPSEYNKPLERCANGTSHPISGPNPILSEPATTKFTSNLPLTLSVRTSGDIWWGQTALVFTNRSSTAFHIDCAVITFVAPSGSGDHNFQNTVTFGHPQQDYVEVPKGGGNSYYIIRLGFHDVPLAQRIAQPGKPFEYQLNGPGSSIAREAIRDSVRFIGDLDLKANDALVKKYGTDRLTN